MDTAAYILGEELQWLQRVLQFRNSDRTSLLLNSPQLRPPLMPRGVELGYGALVEHLQLDTEERLMLILAYAPTIAPQFLDRELAFWTRGLGNNPNGDVQALWGIIYGQMYRGILPSALLFSFILAGDQFGPRLEIARKIAYQRYKPLKEGIVLLSDTPVCEPALCGILSIQPNYAQSLML